VIETGPVAVSGGAYDNVGAGSVVVKDVPDGETRVRLPAKKIE
jgi:serine acetyltransferase